MASSSGSNKLHYAMKSLLEHWEETGTQWRDQVRQEFEEEHVEPLESQVTNTMRAMSKLADVLSKVRRDCSE